MLMVVMIITSISPRLSNGGKKEKGKAAALINK